MAVITCKSVSELLFGRKCAAADEEVDFACGGTDTEPQEQMTALVGIMKYNPPGMNWEAVVERMRDHPRFPAWLFDGDYLIDGSKPPEFYLTVFRYMMDSAHWEPPAADQMAITRSIARGA